MSTQNTYSTFFEYLQEQPNAVILFQLEDFRGEVIDRQMVTRGQLETTDRKTWSARFRVDELLSAKMTPGSYKLFVKIAVPPEGVENPPLSDYLDIKTITEQGISIRVRGGAKQPLAGG